ncbi:hypothetical protein DR864_27255 [Runella rosea]|uniref:Uncharacterized protein n=1 Tax=Runella rosea TaxID=2259595 RepID=A0A344TRA0_9BACT|nr:hypothetical protein [Runella rosea]AXE21171.1 hypothetical protein DR864_27255 [Runella rosea]
MEGEKKKRKRIERSGLSSGLRKGDLIRAVLPGVKGRHICIILEDESADINSHLTCIAVCNFTGSNIPEGEYAINISKYDLPDHWFEEKKADSWIRCNEKDCVKSYEVSGNDKLGNIRQAYPQLWDDVCKAVHSCPISERLKSACNCSFEEIDRKVKEGTAKPSDCGCRQ